MRLSMLSPRVGGGATPGELIINDATSLGNLTILTGPRVGKFDIAAILKNWNNFRHAQFSQFMSKLGIKVRKSFFFHQQCACWNNFGPLVCRYLY
jgi:hypothetical protein